MEALNITLSVLLSIFGIILLIVLIILGIRLIQVINKVDKAVDDTIEKVNAFNDALNIVTKAAYAINKVGDKAINGIANTVSKVFNKKDKENEDEEEDYYE
ncbi:MAG: hypothetical protein IJF92_03190 [Bacilli bacterium]|nr:hypothetical protein [Bacilli bacterium]